MTGATSPSGGPVPDARDYYDDHVQDKVRDYVKGNRRVETALDVVQRLRPEPPRSVLEIGCGVGHVAGRLSAAWPATRIAGVDTSPRSVEVAKRLFGSSRVDFHEGRLEEIGLQGPFDLVVLMDVLEHVAASMRDGLLDGIRGLLSDDALVFVSVPTPQFLAWLRVHRPEQIQPVDEDIDASVAGEVADRLGLSVLRFERVSVWRTHDYAHFVLGAAQIHPLPAATPPSPSLVSRVQRRLSRTSSAAREASERDARQERVTQRLGLPG